MVEYLNLNVRSVRRIRAKFSSALASGAFSTTWFSLVCDDSSTGNPAVVAALAVDGLANVVELALDRDMAEDGSYTLSIAAGVPALDASTAGAVTQSFVVPASQRAPSETVSVKDLHDLVFQEDIAHSLTTGFIEGADGDLAGVTGPESVVANGKRGLVTSGLPHSDWGADLREDVDSPDVRLPALRGKIERQLRRDDRVTGARAKAEPTDGSGEVMVRASLDLVAQQKTNLDQVINARR